MTSRSDKPKPGAGEREKRKKEKEHLNDVLDEALEETFPASDTPAVVRPGHGIPTGKPKKSDG